MELIDKVHNPHDGFFKDVLCIKEAAVNFFENYLPADILNLLNIGALQIQKDSFVEKELKRFYSDILYQVAFKAGKAYIYLLFEHQSSPRKLISFNLLRYMVKIWELILKQSPELKLLPPIIPLVLYHGKDKWDIGTRLSAIIPLGDKKELKSYLPDFSYILYDLSAYSDEEIKGNIMIKIFLDLFKHVFDKDFLSHLENILPLLRALSSKDKTALEFIETVFRYIISTREDATPERLKNLAEKAVSKQTGGMVMTVAEQLIKQGVQKGRQEGELIGRQKGELIGSIRTARLMKGLPGLDKKEFEKLSIEEMKRKLKELTGK